MFCEQCNNLLSTNATSDRLYFKCVSCSIVYEPTDKDSLRYEFTKGTNLVSYKTIALHIADDPVNPKVKKNCPFCKNDMVKQARLGDDMRLTNACIKCKKQWIEGVDMN